MRKFGIVGFPLQYSFSPSYFEAKFSRENINDASYHLFALQDLNALPQLIRQHSELTGLNVTMPFKEKILPFLDYLDPVAEKVQAVNVIKIDRNQDKFSLSGYNTDVTGFCRSLQTMSAVSGKKALVFGTGGAARAVSFVLDLLEIEYLLVSRTKQPGLLTYKEINNKILTDCKLLVNATPVGTNQFFPTLLPIPYNAIGKEHALFDLVYHPPLTPFLQEGKSRGAEIKNGLEMLHIQADESWKIWNCKDSES